jgi:hypothetical protein
MTESLSIADSALAEVPTLAGLSADQRRHLYG